MNDQTFENQIKKIRELEKETARIEREVQELIETLGVTREEIDYLFSNSENFSAEEKALIQEQKHLFEISFQQRTERLRTAEGLKKKYQDLHLSRHWIPVR